MPSRKDILQAPLDRLEHVLGVPATGRERQWASRLAAALGAVGQGWLAHTAESESADGVFTEVDLTRPSLVRQVGALCREHGDLLARTTALQREAQSAACAFTFPALSRAAGYPPGGSGGPREIPDFGLLRQQAEQLLRALRRHQEDETDLVLESVTTDIGVGD
jgi:hypothetical protein